MLNLSLKGKGESIMEYVLRTRGLTKKYRRFEALKGLTMNVPKGAVYGFVGKNGAGKTTLIRLVCGLQLPTSGEIELYGADNKDKSIAAARRRIGAVVETPSVYLDMTAEDNLKQQCMILGLPSFDCVYELLKLVRLDNTGKKKARNFSLGMRQRLGIAVALCGDPDLLLLDEPTNGLDPQGIIDMRELILKLNRERNITVLISSHILDELSRLATHYGFIDDGRIVREMSAEEFQSARRKSIRLTVTDTAALARTLDKMGIGYEIIGESAADVYACPNITELSGALAENGCEILSVTEHDESLESFFISLVGGNGNA